MAVTETQRHDLHTHFQETMGNERAAVVMDLLPPVGWGDVATKEGLETSTALIRKDLDHAVERLDMKMATMATREDVFALKSELTGFHERALDKMGKQLFAMMGINITFWVSGIGFIATLLR